MMNFWKMNKNIKKAWKIRTVNIEYNHKTKRKKEGIKMQKKMNAETVGAVHTHTHTHTHTISL